MLRRSIDLRNPYVDPMNAIQVELLRRHRAGDAGARLPLLRSIAGIAAALGTRLSRNRADGTGYVTKVPGTCAWHLPYAARAQPIRCRW